MQKRIKIFEKKGPVHVSVVSFVFLVAPFSFVAPFVIANVVILPRPMVPSVKNEQK